MVIISHLFTMFHHESPWGGPSKPSKERHVSPMLEQAHPSLLGHLQGQAELRAERLLGQVLMDRLVSPVVSPQKSGEIRHGDFDGSTKDPKKWWFWRMNFAGPSTFWNRVIVDDTKDE